MALPALHGFASVVGVALHGSALLSGTAYSIDPGDWPHLASPELVFTSRPNGSAIPLGAKLLSVRHQTVTSLADLRWISVTNKRIWLRVADPSGSRRKLSLPVETLCVSGCGGPRTLL